MPNTTLCLTDAIVGIDYSIDDGRAIFENAYPNDKDNLGNIDCERLYIRPNKNSTLVRLDNYFQKELDEKCAFFPELLRG